MISRLGALMCAAANASTFARPPLPWPHGRGAARTGQDLLSIPIDGSPVDTVATLPDDGMEYCCDPVFSTDPMSLLCLQVATSSELWLLEDFDPHVN